MSEKVIPTVEYYKRDPIKYKDYIEGVKIHVLLSPVIKLLLYTWYYSFQYRIMQLRGLIK